jgi:hypothetical protein
VLKLEMSPECKHHDHTHTKKISNAFVRSVQTAVAEKHGLLTQANKLTESRRKA